MDETMAALPLRILLVDDDSFMLEILSEMLGELGQHQVSLAATGGAALALLRGDDPQLLICDLSMPDMDGVAFLRLASAAGFRGAVALLSGLDAQARAAAGQAVQNLELRILGVYPKPIAPDALAQVLAMAAEPDAEPGTTMQDNMRGNR